MVRRTAAILGMLGFGLACLVGALAGVDLETALFRALVAMVGFFVVGLGVGRGAELLLREHFKALAGEEADAQPAPPTPPRPAPAAAADNQRK